VTHFAFHLEQIDANSSARAGIWKTPHGDVSTPAFMPVGTQATVKGLTVEQLKSTGSQMVLSNTYHLALRPGADVIAELGGLHKFMGWDGPILTDSGGFQIFSLAKIMKIDDHAAVFRSHIDGSRFELTPEESIGIQEKLGADCIMCLDECPPHDVSDEKKADAVRRTSIWAKRCRDAKRRDDQALFGIVQGGLSQKYRQQSAEGLVPLDFPGYALGGLSVGEKPEEMYDTLDFSVPMLPEAKPRYLMGVGRPIDLIEGVLRGIDLFDCVMPTRNGRNATAFTSTGKVRLRNFAHQRDESPLDSHCNCYTCLHHSRAYLRHLFIAGELLGQVLVSLHNLAFYQELMKSLREAIFADRVEEIRTQYLACESRYP